MRTAYFTCAAGVLAALLSTSIRGAESDTSYLCVTDKSTGFYFNKASKNWILNAPPAHGKYVVSRTKLPKAEWTWEIKEVGALVPMTTCRDDFGNEGDLYCSGLYEFRMSRKSMRFLAAYLHGYFSDYVPDYSGVFKSPPSAVVVKEAPEGSDTPYMEIGNCSPI